MQSQSSAVAPKRKEVSFEDVHAATLCVHIEYWRAEAEDREPQVSAVLDRFLEVNPSGLDRATARLLVAVVLYQSSLVDDATKVKLRARDVQLRRWLEENVDPLN
jgi:hypothetical protein